MSDLLVVVSKVKAAVEARVGADAIDAISDHVATVIQKAENIATEAGMKTIKAEHISEAVASIER